MISSSCDIKEFLEEVKNKDLSEMVLLADMEALSAWRMSRRHRKQPDPAQPPCNRYETLLKEFVRYARSGVFPKKSNDPHYSVLRSFYEERLSKRTANGEGW
jgi:hypothetical protein